jgi:hypothetical protein
MLKWHGLGLLLGVVLANIAWAQDFARFDGQYVGELTLTKVINGNCTPPSLGSLYPLTISAGQVQFKYDPRFDTVLRGHVNEDGTFMATRLLRKGQVMMIGYIQGRNITGYIESPSCRYTFETKE